MHRAKADRLLVRAGVLPVCDNGQCHGGESRDFRILKMADSCQSLSIQVRLSLLLRIRLTLGLKQISGKMKVACPSLAFFRKRSG